MSLIRPLSGRKPVISLPKGAIDTQMHAYLPGYPPLPAAQGSRPVICRRRSSTGNS